MLPAEVEPVLYVDDLCVACSSKLAAERTIDAVRKALAALPGSLEERLLNIHNVEDGFDFLGYRFELDPEGEPIIEPSNRSIERLLDKMLVLAREYQDLPPAQAYDNLEARREMWKKAFPLARFGPEYDLFLEGVPKDALIQVNCEGHFLKSGDLSETAAS
jgi:hypothetical protein